MILILYRCNIAGAILHGPWWAMVYGCNIARVMVAILQYCKDRRCNIARLQVQATCHFLYFGFCWGNRRVTVDPAGAGIFHPRGVGSFKY